MLLVFAGIPFTDVMIVHDIDDRMRRRVTEARRVERRLPPRIAR